MLPVCKTLSMRLAGHFAKNKDEMSYILLGHFVLGPILVIISNIS